MKNLTLKPKSILVLIAFVLGLGFNQSVKAQDDYVQYKGEVVDSQSGNKLASAILTLENTNISTITNSEGEFSLKVPKSEANHQVKISSIGYNARLIDLNSFKKDGYKIELKPSVIELSEVNVNIPKDAGALVRKTLRKKGENNVNEHLLMTAFYRETIKKRKRNVSLAEAVVNVYKKPYSSSQNDDVELYKSRKSTDYKKLDTVALKLQGGPFNPLYGDLMKYPEYIFTAELIDDYSFRFDQSTVINGKPVYVINFKPLEDIREPRYYGKLFIDSNTLALVSANYNLNVENKDAASRLFVRKRPKDILVYPTEASYKVDYREKEGKWYYGYSNIQLTFKVNHRKRIFNSMYSLTSEMAVTDWETNTDKFVKPKDRMRPSVVISDEASGFSDPEFWGSHNVIEPEKSIENAINKIKKKLSKT